VSLTQTHHRYPPPPPIHTGARFRSVLGLSTAHTDEACGRALLDRYICVHVAGHGDKQECLLHMLRKLYAFVQGKVGLWLGLAWVVVCFCGVRAVVNVSVGRLVRHFVWCRRGGVKGHMHERTHTNHHHNHTQSPLRPPNHTHNPTPNSRCGQITPTRS
jgi:hypothetical protein